MNTDTMTLRGQTLPLCRLDTFFNIFRPGPVQKGSRVVVSALGQRRVGLVIDALVGQQDIIIKPLGASMAKAGCFTGVTDVGDQKLALVHSMGSTSIHQSKERSHYEYDKVQISYRE
jgi:two-component system chemotaxis sensor kinase CheA